MRTLLIRLVAGAAVLAGAGAALEARVRRMARQSPSSDDISKMLQIDYGWGTLNTGGLDRMIAEFK